MARLSKMSWPGQEDYEKQLLIEAGLERAKFWGWHNVYTYTKSIGEQVLAASGLPFTIGRPAVIESALDYPKAGWNEGINTSAPLISWLQGLLGFPSRKDCILDVIPVDQVAAGMVLSLAELLEGSQKAVYQYGSSEVNPLYMERLIELVGLAGEGAFKKEKGRAMDWVHQHYAPVPMSTETYFKWGPRRLGGANSASGFLDRVSRELKMFKPVVEPAAPWRALRTPMWPLQMSWISLSLHGHPQLPLCVPTRGCVSASTDEEQDLLPWNRVHRLAGVHPEIHIPGIDENVVPLIREDAQKSKATEAT